MRRGLKNLISKIWKQYHIVREAYHGGDFNGVCVRRFMASANKNMEEIAAVLKQESKGHVSNAEIDRICAQYADLFTCMDGAFSALRTENPTCQDVDKAREFVTKTMERWRSIGLSVTPKAHVFEDHAVEKMNDYLDFGGLFDMLEDFVELSHQEGARLQHQFRSMPNFEQKHNAIHRAERVQTDPVVKRNLQRMRKKREDKKRTRRGKAQRTDKLH